MKSKLTIKSILIITIIGIMSLVYFNASFAANTAKVNADTVNIRKSADTNSDIVEQANKNEEVEIIEKTGQWYKVKYNGVQGYLRSDLISVAETTEDLVAENTATSTANTEEVKEETSQEAKKEDNSEVATEVENTEKENTDDQVTGIYTCKENTKLKIMPLIMGKDIKDINKDDSVNVLEVNNKWALVESGTNRGWVLISKIEKVNNTQNKEQTEGQEEKKEEEQPKEETSVQEKTMYVNSEVINVRKEADKESDSLTKLSKGTKVTVIAETNGWSKVKVNNYEGYILSTLLSETRPEVTTSRNLDEARSNTQTSNSETNTSVNTATGSATGTSIANYAQTYIGNSPYVYGGSSPSGFDCSGFTSYVYSQYGVGLSRTAQGQYSNGTSVSKSELQIGDLVMFGSSASSINHVGIYIGNGNIVHAANPSRGVTIDTINSGYYNNNYVGARRVVN